MTACDYGFHNKSGIYTERGGPTTPANVVRLAISNFRREWEALRESLEESSANTERSDSGWLDDNMGGDGDMLGSMIQDEDLCFDMQNQLDQLTLDAEGVWKREFKRDEYDKKRAPWLIKIPYFILCWVLDKFYPDDEPVQRFWLLETVARMPYFSYISMLHLYETLGWWRKAAAVKRVHFAEEWNEFHHLLIMESLGGDERWRDRFIANHAAIVYYWVLNALWLISPLYAYKFSELIECHADDTYSQFLEDNKALLQTLPAPAIAKQYYQNEDLYMFDEFQTSRQQVESRRRPVINTLYDTFVNIRDDEKEHVKTMIACQNVAQGVRSPHQK